MYKMAVFLISAIWLEYTLDKTCASTAGRGPSYGRGAGCDGVGIQIVCFCGRYFPSLGVYMLSIAMTSACGC